MNFSLADIGKSHIATALCLFAGTCGAGLMITYEFQRDFFEKADIVRLILWATAIPLPCFFINVGILQDGFRDKKELHAPIAGIFALTYTAVTLPLAVVICHQFGFNFSDFVWLVGASHLIALSIVICARISAKRAIR